MASPGSTGGTARAERWAPLTRGITRNVVALGVVSLLTDISSEMLVYVIPLFLANVLAASPSVIGLIEGIAESVASLLRLVSGRISDALGRRRLLVGIGYSGSVLGKALFLLATSWPIVLVARLFDRIGKGIRTAPRDALITDSTPADARGRAFGFHRAMDTTGAVLGVAGAALIVTLAQGDAIRISEGTFRDLVLIALVPGILAVVTIVIGVRDVRGRGSSGSRAAAAAGPSPVAGALPAAGPSPAAIASPAPESAAPARAPESAASAPAADRARATPARSLARLASGLPRVYWLFVLATFLFTLGNSSDAFLALRSQQLGIAVRDLLLVIIAFNVTNAVVAWPAGALSDRIGRRGLIALAWTVYGLAYLGFALAGPGSAVVLLWLVYGAYYGVNDAVGKALVADLAPEDRRGTAFGIINAVVGFTLLPASLLAGVLWDAVGPAAPFWFGAACAAAATVLLLATVRPPTRSRAAD